MLYLRKEPTTDSATLDMRKATGCKPRKGGSLDVVAYADEQATKLIARWPWYYSNKPKKSQRTVMLNCYRQPCQWIAQ